MNPIKTKDLMIGATHLTKENIEWFIWDVLKHTDMVMSYTGW